MATELQVGDSAPDFTTTALGGEYGTGQTVRLQDFTGKHIILYFYPKDDTPGCTAQACGVRDRWPDFQRENAVLFGVSTDSLASHQKFIDKYGLPFPLLSDESGDIVRAYGVWVEKSFLGVKSMGTERSSFVIGPDGKIAAIFRRVKPDEHAAQILDSIKTA